MNLAVIITAAGSGSRFGSQDNKIFSHISGSSLIERSVNAFCRALPEARIVITYNHQDLEKLESLLDSKKCTFVLGGKTRQESVLNGLEFLSKNAPEYVLIHDAARPLIPEQLILKVYEALKAGAKAVIPSLPVTDSVCRVVNHEVAQYIAREGLHNVQTPQGFYFPNILTAHATAKIEKYVAADDASLIIAQKQKVLCVEGEACNIKITHPQDLVVAENLLKLN